jgi:hypothetical protein
VFFNKINIETVRNYSPGEEMATADIKKKDFLVLNKEEDRKCN